MDTVCSERRALASELAQLHAMARELELHVDEDSPAARELCRVLASSVDRAVRVAGSSGCPEPANAGSPRGGDDGLGHAGKNGQFKKRKGTAKVRSQVRVTSVQDLGPLDDGLSWRKYGQKDILGAKYPRAYFRCTHRHTQGCHATKQVQRADGDPLLFDVVYHGAHTCAQAAQQQQPRDGGVNRLPLYISAEQQPDAGQEQSSPVAAEPEGVQWLEPMTPFSFPSSPAGIGSGAINGCFPFLSSVSYGRHYYEGCGGLGVDMDIEIQLDELFSTPSELFQPGMHNM